MEGAPKDVHLEYLDYMNTERMEMAEKERARQEAEEQANPEKADEKEAAKKKKRYGSMDCMFTEINILDANGNPQKTFRTGEEMILDLHYECKKKVTDAVFGFGIFRSDGLWCYGTNTRIDHKDNFDIERDGSYRVDLKELMLIPAEYWVDVTIEYGEGNPVDYYKEALRFEVVSKVSDVGVLRIPHEWTLNI